MSNTNSLVRSLHDVGIASWFGGSLMGAIGLNGGASAAKDSAERTTIANAGWAKWAPVNAVGIVTHAVGGVGLILANKGRLGAQQGVGAATAIKLGLTIAAAASTAYSGGLGAMMARKSPDQTVGVTEPSSQTNKELADAQKQQKVMQWVTPALTGAVILMAARMGEQQRTASVVSGIESRLRDRLT